MREQQTEMMYLLQGQWQAIVIEVVNLLLVVWLAYVLSQIFWLLIHVPQAQQGVQFEPVAASTQTYQASRALAKQVAEMHIFGVPVTEQVSVEPTPLEIPDTHLEIVLHGTFSSDDSRISHALISDISDKGESYAIGEEVSVGIKVHEILADRVILRRNQRYETLRLLNDYNKGAVVTTGLAATNKTGYRSDSQGLPFLKKLPVSLNTYVNPLPVRVGGEFIGLRLMPIKETDLLDKIGLQRGDVITRINEVDLDTPMKGVRAIKSISSGDDVNMTVRRRGRVISLSFHMP